MSKNKKTAKKPEEKQAADTTLTAEPTPPPIPKPASGKGERQLGIELRYDGEGATLTFVGDGETLSDPVLAGDMNSLLSAAGAILLAAGPPKKEEPIRRIQFSTPLSPGGPAAMKPFIRQALHSEGVKKPGTEQKKK